MESTKSSPSDDNLAVRILRRLARHIEGGQRVVAALSGGLDSVVLLHVLCRAREERGIRLSALHVNHGLSPNAGEWQAFCEACCADWRVPLTVRTVRVRSSGGGLEAAAREARYTAFAQAGGGWLVLAHHRGDQAETVLFNLFRGAGVEGAAGMSEERTVSGNPNLRLLRPMLDIPRSEIECYARGEGLRWVEDESNLDLRHSRNYLRHALLPEVARRFPAAEGTLARAAGHFAEAERLLAELAALDARDALHGGRIRVPALHALGRARARNLLRHVLRATGTPVPDTARLQEMLRQFCEAAPDRDPFFQLGALRLCRYRDEVWLVTPGRAGERVEWQGEPTLAWGSETVRFAVATGTGISRSRLSSGCVTVRARAGGERMQIHPQRPHRDLRKLAQEAAVPPWRRTCMPLLWCGESLVWAGGLGVDAAWHCHPGEDGIVATWVAPAVEELSLP